MSETKLRGFAALPAERRREIARLGGKAIPSAKRFFAASREGASRAGQKGGKATPRTTQKDLLFLDRIAAGAFIVTAKTAKRTKARAQRLLKLNLLRLIKHTEYETIYTVSSPGYRALGALRPPLRAPG